MIERCHGIDRHKNYSTIQVVDREGEKIKLYKKVINLKEYVDGLSETDAVILEASNGVFYWADQIEKTGAKCVIVDPHKFKIIKDSWKKTDKIDAINLANSLWIAIIADKFQLPEVYKPSMEVRELRKLFTQYNLLTKNIVQYKNNIQALLVENGVVLKSYDLKQLYLFTKEEEWFELQISEASKIIIQSMVRVISVLKAEKEHIVKEITLLGNNFKKELEILLSIKGVSVLMALAFIADIADPKRFKKLKQMNAYLGVVPGVKGSGGKVRDGHINKASRKLARTIFTQSIHHAINSNITFKEQYEDLKYRRGAGRARIAFMRKMFGIMRRMLLSEEKYKWVDEKLYIKKLKQFDKSIEKIQLEKKSA